MGMVVQEKEGVALAFGLYFFLGRILLNNFYGNLPSGCICKHLRPGYVVKDDGHGPLGEQN